MALTFEWHEDKRQSNINLHGVDFIRAAQIFLKPRFEAIDDRHDYGEERIRAIGTACGDIYVVVYTKRGDAIRLIFAWKAGQNDRRKYHARFNSSA